MKAMFKADESKTTNEISKLLDNAYLLTTDCKYSGCLKAKTFSALFFRHMNGGNLNDKNKKKLPNSHNKGNHSYIRNIGHN